MGWQFHKFVQSLAAAHGTSITARPPAVEAYLPISSLMSLTHLVKSGQANPVRPAGLVLFSLILGLTVLMRRGFCSWVCPVGTLSEYAHKAGRKLLGRNLAFPRWVDVLLALSVVFKNFWCRYLCPYGALLCLASLVSPLKVRRHTRSCVGCGRCTGACPNRIAVDAKEAVSSPECTACYSCVEACPADALRLAPRARGRAVPAAVYGAIVVAAFIFVPQAARALGYWRSNTPAAVYRMLHQRAGSIRHPRGGMGYRPDSGTPRGN